jgi:hypothetical protein
VSDRIDLNEVHRQVGAICVAATRLQWELEDTVVSLARTDRIAALVQGERNDNLARWIDRLIKQYESDNPRSAALIEAVNSARRLLDQRDLVVHSVWLLKNTTPGHVTGTRTRRTQIESRLWSLVELEQLRQEMEKAPVDLYLRTREFLEAS